MGKIQRILCLSYKKDNRKKIDNGSVIMVEVWDSNKGIRCPSEVHLG